MPQLAQNSNHDSTLNAHILFYDSDIDDDSWGSEFDESPEDEREQVNLSQEEKDNRLNTLIAAQLDQCRPPSKRKQHRSRDSADQIIGNVSSLFEKFKSKISQITYPVMNPSGQTSSDSTPSLFSSRSVSQISPVFSRSSPVLPSAPPPDSNTVNNQISWQLPTRSTATCSNTASSFAGEFSSIPHVLPKTNSPDSSTSKRQALPSPPISSPDSSNVPSSIYPQISSYLAEITSEVCSPNKSPKKPPRKQNQQSITESPGAGHSPALGKELAPPPLPSRPPPPINRFMAKLADPISERTASISSENISASSGVKKKCDASEIRAEATSLKPPSEVRKNDEATVIHNAAPVKPLSAVKKNAEATVIHNAAPVKPPSVVRKNDEATVIHNTAPVKPPSAVRKNDETRMIHNAAPVKPPSAVRKNGEATVIHNTAPVKPPSVPVKPPAVRKNGETRMINNAAPVKPPSAVRKNGEATMIQTVATPAKPPSAMRKNEEATAIQTPTTPSLKLLPTVENELGTSSASLAAMRGPLPPPSLPKRIPHLTPELAELAAASNVSIQKQKFQSNPDNPSLMRNNEENATDKENSAISENPVVDDYLPPRKDSKILSVKNNEETTNSSSNAFQKFSAAKKDKNHSPERPALPEKISSYQRSKSLTSLVATSIIGNTTSKVKNLIAAKDPDRRKSSAEHTLGLRISNPIVVKQGSDVEKMTLTLLPTTHLGTETPSQETLSQRPWYHQVEWKEARRRIEAMKYDGAFLVRPSNRAHEGVPYVLCVNYLGKVFSLQVRCKTDGSYALGMEKSEEKSFSSLDKLIRFYQTTPLKLHLPESDSQSFVRLLVTPPKE